MSHLPLDARAILQHLNELGYRNISAEQLREFLKGMQPQSDKQSASKLATTTAATATATAKNSSNNNNKQPQQQSAAAQQKQQQQLLQRPKVKVIKSKRPLCHFKFYLDIRDHQLTKRIESDIKALGGTLEFFLNESITHFITDRPTAPSGNAAATQLNSPATPGTPQTPLNLPHQDDAAVTRNKTRQTRADAILSRVRQQQQKVVQQPQAGAAPPYIIWQTDYAQRFFKRIQTELRDYIEGKANLEPNSNVSLDKKTANNNNTHIQLKGQFIKIEAVKRNYRPYYQLLKKPEEWPKIDLSSEDGAFRLQAKATRETKTPTAVVEIEIYKEKDQQSMTRKSQAQAGSRTSQRQQQEKKEPQHAALQALKKSTAINAASSATAKSQPCKELKESSDKQCGVCEICKIEYDTLTIHLKTKDHEYFAKNAENFRALDTLIQASADVNKFLAEEAPHQEEQDDDEEEEEEDIEQDVDDMDVDELLCDSAITNTNTQTPTTTIEALPQSPSDEATAKLKASPALREKSKRITKGKHSSEKFTTTPSPRQLSPSKGVGGAAAVGKTQVSPLATPTTATVNRKKIAQVTPPMRAMLPPSSLYKVVDVAASDVCATPPRSRRATCTTAGVMDSPSIIVKFQKVRQSELQRLNGEAENFMFPKTATTTRSSSELPTDVDRQTTSDRARHSVSSASLDSTSEAEPTAAITENCIRKRATAVAKRRKGGGTAAAQPLLQRQLSTGSSSSNGPQQQQQRFPSAPIQPAETETQLLKPKLTLKAEALSATRKSSRMATAIVTAATTSSQLQRRQHNTRRSTTKATNSKAEAAAQLEDRMGESEGDKEEELPNESQEDDEEDDDDEDDDDDDDGSDEDYIAQGGSKQQRRLSALPCRPDTREERAARRMSRLTINRSGGGELELQLSVGELKTPTKNKSPKKLVTPKSKSKKEQQQQQKSPLSSPQSFDFTKSERLKQLRYAFEQLPSADLWHRVFQRQDAAEEKYHTYYGSTRYRKLPYELGPILKGRMSDSGCCKLCQQEKEQELKSEPAPVKQEKAEQKLELDKPTASTSSSAATLYKHKKLHLLQRYQLEQQQRVEEEGGNPTAIPNTMMTKCDSKASTPELLERDFVPLSERGILIHERMRADSTQSSTSSSCSANKYRNKQLQRIAELPPRKSPREHASTLALVSCIIRQRQDSQSKTNSEVELEEEASEQRAEIEAAELASKAAAEAEEAKLKTPVKQELVNASPRNTRSQAATPVEELRFATEISETVKRMRRGQNKYDHSPPVPPPPPRPTTSSSARPARGRRPTAAAPSTAPTTTTTTTTPLPLSSSSHSYSRRLQFAARRELPSSLKLGKRKRKYIAGAGAAAAASSPAVNVPGQGYGPGVRKLGTKKGVLEFEMDASALKNLGASLQYANPRLAAWQLDKYLELVGKEYDLTVEDFSCEPETRETRRESERERVEELAVQTPPPTDCFTSDFDLCDLMAGSGGSGDDEECLAKGRGLGIGLNLGLYSSAAMQSYYRKRKSLKSNRTGWPKTQQRRRQHGHQTAGGGGGGGGERIHFHKMGIHEEQQKIVKQEPLETEEEQTTTTTATTADKVRSKTTNNDEEDEDDDDGTTDKRRAEVMTPPATDVEAGEEAAKGDEESIAEEEEDDDETMADSIEEPQDDEAEIEATDADVEEEEEEEDEEEENEDDNDDNDDEEDVFEDAYEHPPPPQLAKKQPTTTLSHDEPSIKRARLQSSTSGAAAAAAVEGSPSPGKRLIIALHNTNGHGHLLNSSTPQLARRTPQLNGSLGSCISPSEKLGDNSDIFTVSSDGLDTDLDLSNPQAGDELPHCPHQQTPKRKFDISKYAPGNNAKAASSCAAEAATAAVKSLAISQFLKKEVRVTCRRLRAPFRRFRYRR